MDEACIFVDSNQFLSFMRVKKHNLDLPVENNRLVKVASVLPLVFGTSTDLSTPNTILLLMISGSTLK